MKKIIFAVLGTASGLLAMSCDVESLNDKSFRTNEVKAATENLDLQKSDSIPQNSGTTSSDGPGDQTLIIIPPKRPK